MKTISIMGLGLMGSSLGLALKKRKALVNVRAYVRHAEAHEVALKLGAADAVFDDPVEAVRGADLVVFCIPILKIPELAKACLQGLAPGAILTDVGSTKAELTEKMDSLLWATGSVFVGSHPICGSEQHGMEAGHADLYDGAVTVVTPSSNPSSDAVEKVSTLWKRVGSTVLSMGAEEHDQILAMSSHLPHIVASALVQCSEDGRFCGSGFFDTTRIAAGSPEIWSDIVRTNSSALKGALDLFRTYLDQLRILVENGDKEALSKWFSDVRHHREKLIADQC